MAKQNNIDIQKKMSLPAAIQKSVGRISRFSNLENFEKRTVLEYIKNNKLDIKVFGEKYFDVLTQKFYAEEYLLDDEYASVYQEIRGFDSFQEFFIYVDGDINDACFYGYVFSDELKRNYSIDEKSLNLVSFVDRDISFDTFEGITTFRDQIDELNAELAIQMAAWLEKIKPSFSPEKIADKLQQFNNLFTFYDARYVFFSYILKKYKKEAKESLIEYLHRYGEYTGISFTDIILKYGYRTAKKFLEKAHFSENKYRFYERILNEYPNNLPLNERKIEFKRQHQFYCVTDRYPSGVIATYFFDFDELVKYVNGNLSGADFSHAPLNREDILKYKTDLNTILPFSKTYKTYSIKKQFTKGEFNVCQRWFDENNVEILNCERSFKHFFDFAYYLQGDISDTDLIMCDGIENIKKIPNLKLDGIKIRSIVAEKLGLPLRLIPKDRFKIKDFKETNKYELETVENLLMEHPDDDDYSGRVSYITDIHLLHRFDAYKCKTLEDVNYVIKTIAKTIGEQATSINLIGGDTSSDFEIFKAFVSNLSLFRKRGVFFFTLGNHELWGMNGESLSSIVEKYKEVLEQKGHGRMHLIQNNLFYFSEYDWKELSENELFSLSSDEIRAKTRAAKVIIFGGIGFAGMSEEFNANNGIYEDVLDREDEKNESTKFLTLYEKITKALQNRNLIVFTHMPMKDWGGVDMHAKEGVVYVNGHSHRNYFYDDGKKRIYADNQVGYRGRRLSLKQVAINFDFDWFEDYKDGIYEITKEDYENFYRGVGEGLTFNRQYEKLFMIKREGAYMFLMQTPKGSMLILNGGSIKRAGNHSLEYFYDNLVKYSKSVSLFLSKFDAYQKQVSSELKKIGADGTIHGSIVDIDFYNHLYLNPLDGSVTPYFAYSMVDKYFYDNLPSLLKYQCPKIYQNYQRLIEQKDAIDNALVVRDSNLPVSKHKTYVGSTEMYKVSRILKGLQFTTKYNIVRLWNDAIVADASEENGRLIVSGIIDPDSMPKPMVEIKPKVKIVREPKPKVLKVVLSEEEKIKIRDDKYKEKIMSETNGKISCTTYRGSTEKADYHCNVCDHEWSTRPDHFKDRQLYQCPACSGTRIKRTFPINARQENDDEERTKEKEVHIVSKHEDSGIKTIRKNEREKMIDSLILVFIKDNNGLFSKQELFKRLSDNKGVEANITKNSVINSVSRLEEKNYVVVSSGKIFITDEGIKSVSKQ